jgi:hypothetical protein
MSSRVNGGVRRGVEGNLRANPPHFPSSLPPSLPASLPPTPPPSPLSRAQRRTSQTLAPAVNIKTTQQRPALSQPTATARQQYRSYLSSGASRLTLDHVCARVCARVRVLVLASLSVCVCVCVFARTRPPPCSSTLLWEKDTWLLT